MFSGGFFGNYEWCIGDYCTSWDTVVEQYSAADNFFREALEEAYVTSEDPLGNFIDNFTWPERVAIQTIGVITGQACARGDEDRAQQTARPANLEPAQEQYLDPNYSSGRDWNAFWRSRPENYSGSNLGVRVPNLTQQALHGWCTLMLDGRYFVDGNHWYTTDDGTCDQWALCNYDHQANPGLNRIFHTARMWREYPDFDECGRNMDDDYDDIAWIGKRLDARWEGPIPGMVWWHPSVTDAWQYFDETSGALKLYKDTTRDVSVRDEFFVKFSQIVMEGALGLIEKELPYIDIITPNHNSTEAMLQAIFQRMAACGADFNLDELVFGTKWKIMDEGGPQNRPPVSTGNDWVTPLVHAGALYYQMVELYMKRWNELTNEEKTGMLDTGQWELVKKDDEMFYIIQLDIVDPATGQPREIEIFEYMNDVIWRRSGEAHETLRTQLIGKVDEQERVTAWGEIGDAVNRSLSRCRRCSEVDPVHIWARTLIDYIDIMRRGISLDISPTVHIMDRLEELARPRTLTAEDCCRQTPPHRFNAAARACFEQSYYEYCFNQRPALMFDPAECECSTNGAQSCFDIPPPGTHVFVYDPATQTSRCEPCPPGQTTTTGLAGSCATPRVVEAPVCGNHRVEGREQCDDGNTNNNDGCRNDCTRPPVPTAECGNGRVERGEECDGTPNCDDSCKIVAAPPPPPPPACDCVPGNGVNICTSCGNCGTTQARNPVLAVSRSGGDNRDGACFVP